MKGKENESLSNAKLALISIATLVVLFISKISGFFRDIALAYTYGTSGTSDAYVLSTTIISLFTIFSTAFSLAFMPICMELSVTGGEQKKRFIDRLYTLITAAVILLSILLMSCADPLVTAFAPGFGSSTHDTAAMLLEILLVTLPATFIVTLGGQQLRAENTFLIPAAIAIPLNLVLMAVLIFISPVYGINSLGWGYVLGVGVQLLWTCAVLGKKGYRYHPEWGISDRELRKVLVLTVPILIGNAIQSINTIIDRILASGLLEGSMAALNFSNKLAMLVISMSSLGVGNVCYSKMSDLGARKKQGELILFMRQIINILTIIVVPATIGMMVLNIPIITAVFEYGAFDKNSGDMTATALYFYAIGLVGYSIRDIITRAFYSMQDSRTPMINGILSVLLNIILSIALSKRMGIGGIALATSVSAVFGSLILLISLRKKCGRVGGKEMGLTFLKCCAAGIVMGFCVSKIYTYSFMLIGNTAFALLIAVLLGITIYGGVMLLMKVKEIDTIRMLILK